MIELVIERWSEPDGTTYRWSLWRAGKRVAMGQPQDSAEAAEAAAIAACVQEFGVRPERVTAL
jgi:hypothetical protein